MSAQNTCDAVVKLKLEDVELLFREIQLSVEVSPTRNPKTLLFGPARVTIPELNAEAFDLTLREALDMLEFVIRFRIEEILTDSSPDQLLEDRSIALPLALKLWAADRRGRLRRELEISLALPKPVGRGRWLPSE